MTVRSIVLLLAAAAAACSSSGGGTAPVDAPTSGSIDAPVSLPADAPAPPDAPSPDAPPPSIQLPSAIVVPTDPTAVVYPDTFSNAVAATVTDVDPYCRATSSTIAYPKSYLGAFPLPAISGAPLPPAMKRGIQLKDFWPLDDPAFNDECHGQHTIHEAYEATLDRAVKLGIDYVAITNWPKVVSVDAAVPVLDLTHPGNSPAVAESELAYFAAAAASRGIAARLYMQTFGVDDQGKPLPSNPTQAWFSGFLDAYHDFIVSQATLAQADGFEAITLNWVAWNPQLDQYQDLYAAKLLVALADVRKVFSGKVILVDNFYFADLSKLDALLGAVDEIMPKLQPVFLSMSENQNLTYPLLKQKMHDFMSNDFASFEKYGKPYVFSPLFQSHRDFFYTGWHEDANCDATCTERDLSVDFSIQAMGYEALFEDLAARGIATGDFEANGYWYTDTILGESSFPDIGQTVRDKPAEAILYRWFKR